MLRSSYRILSSMKNEEWKSEFLAILNPVIKYNYKFIDGDKFYNSKVRWFIYCELLMYTAVLVYEKDFTLDELLVLFSGVHNRFISVDKEKQRIILQANIFLNSFMPTEHEKRKVIVNFYFKQRYKETSCIQLFKMKSNSLEYRKEKIYINTDVYDEMNRKESYYKLLCEESYIQLKEARDTEGILNDVISRRVEERIKRGKIEFNQILNDINRDMVSKMDECIEGSYYIENYDSIDLIKLRDGEDKYKHIVGKTGHGKTVMLDIYINKLVKEQCKVLYITDTHNPNSINTKIRLDKFGIKTNIITGKDRNKYLNSFIEKNSRKSIPELAIEYSDLFNNLDSQCTYGEASNCKACTIETCGYLNMYNRIEESDVIITTPFNLIDSSVNVKVDRYKRSINELMTLWADIVIWDEVDKLQIIGDDRMVSMVQAYSLESVDDSKDEHLEMFLKIINKELKRKKIDDQDIRSFKALVRHYDDEADLFHYLFLRNDGNNLIRKKYGNRRFTIQQLIEDFAKEYISKVSSYDGKNIDKENYGEFIYYILLHEIEAIRKIMFKGIMDDYKFSDSFDDKKVYDLIFTKIKSIISNVDYSELEKKEVDQLEVDFEISRFRINFKQTSKERKLERSIFLSFITMLVSIEHYLQNIYDKGQGFLETIENTHDYIRMSGNPNNHIMALKPLIRNCSGFSLKVENTKETKLIHNNYMAIGREVLFNNSAYLCLLYGIPDVYNIYTSATSAGTGASKYDFFLKPDTLLKRKNTEFSKVNVKCHIFCNENGPLKVSGVDYRIHKLAVSNLARKVGNDIILPDIKERNTGILISTTSYENAQNIQNELWTMGLSVKVIYNEVMGDFNKDIHINKLNIEEEGMQVDVLVGINVILERGLNIVDENNKSYFRDIIIFNRALPTPNDILEEVSYIHKELYVDGQSFRDTKSEMYKTLKNLRYRKGYSSMTKKVKESIAGNTFVSMKQLIGRGQRGGTSVTLHLVDSSFYPETADKAVIENIKEIVDTPKTSLFASWLKLVNSNNEVIDYLYDDIKEGLNNYEIITHR